MHNCGYIRSIIYARFSTIMYLKGNITAHYNRSTIVYSYCELSILLIHNIHINDFTRPPVCRGFTSFPVKMAFYGITLMGIKNKFHIPVNRLKQSTPRYFVYRSL